MEKIILNNFLLLIRFWEVDIRKTPLGKIFREEWGNFLPIPCGSVLEFVAVWRGQSDSFSFQEIAQKSMGEGGLGSVKVSLILNIYIILMILLNEQNSTFYYKL